MNMMKIKYLLVLLTLAFVKLQASEDISKTKFYSFFEIVDNKIADIGIGYREIVNTNCLDWNIAICKPYKVKDFKVFYPVILNVNYMYFFPKKFCYTGIGMKIKADLI